MEQYVIKGGNPLVGEVEIGGAKNAALAIISAAVMTDETVTIENLPNVRDINWCEGRQTGCAYSKDERIIYSQSGCGQ